AKFLNMKSIGICSKNTLAGSLPFQIACSEQGIKSIIGETISICYNYEEQLKEYKKDSDDIESFVPETCEAILYVRNEKGWRNLLRINYYINVLDVPGEGDGKSSYVKWGDLTKLNKG